MDQSAERLSILGLRVSNYKRIEAVELRPDGQSVVIGGRNAQGKSSLLDAIADALGGAKRGSGATQPLRSGALRGEVQVDLGAYVVTRTWREGSDRLVVESPPGSPLRSPQAVLDRLVGDLAFDPLAFLRQASKAQAETLRRLTGLDLRDLDERRAALYAERTAANALVRRAKALRDEAAPQGQAPPQPPARPAVADLLAARDAARARIARLREVLDAPGDAEAELADLERRREDAGDTAAESATRGEAARMVAASLGAALRTLSESGEDAARCGLGAVVQALLDELAETRDAAKRTAAAAASEGEDARRRLEATAGALGAARASLAAARTAAERAQEEIRAATEALETADAALRDADRAAAAHDAARRACEDYERGLAEYRRRAEELRRAEGAAADLSASISTLDEERLARIAATTFPVQGLELDGEEVRYRGVPLAQASQAEQVRVAFAVASAASPALRVALVREGALLDDASLAALLASAREAGCQLWIETVGERDAQGAVGVVIEDGRRADEAAAVEA